jgi:hypothetical protein
MTNCKQKRYVFRDSIRFCILVLVSVLLFGTACGDLRSEDSDLDAGPDVVVVDTETETETESEVDTGENEIPPDAGFLCEVDISNHMVTESTGDLRSPEIVFGSAPLLTWAHGKQQSNPDWMIEVAPYDPEIGSDTDSSGDTDPVGPISLLANSGPLSRDAILVARAEQFGVAWLEGKFDSNCGPTNWDDCLKEVMFLRVDAMGQPIDSPEPGQVTNLVASAATVPIRPSIAATSTGYLLVWNEKKVGEVKLMARALDASGNFVDSASHQISTELGVYPTQQSIVAALGGTVVVVWVSSDQRAILTRTLDATGTPTGDVKILEAGVACLSPDIVAGNDGFMISWSRRPLSDFEIFTVKLDPNGVQVGPLNRVTWTESNVMESVLAWDATQSRYAIAWASTMANGDSDAMGNAQVFTSVLDNTGRLASNPVQLSDNPNTCSQVALSWDKGGWTSIWEQQGNARKQLVLGRMKCK